MVTAPTWTCDACAHPIAAGEGYVWCDYVRALRRHADRQRRDHERMAQPFPEPDDMGLLPEGGAPIPWHVHHTRCDPDPEAAAYSIEIRRIDTWPLVVGWCAHLMGKQWLAETDWPAILRRIGGRS